MMLVASAWSVEDLMVDGSTRVGMRVEEVTWQDGIH